MPYHLMNSHRAVKTTHLKLLWNQCESGTLTEPLKAHAWSQRLQVTGNISDTALGLSRDGRDQDIGIRFPVRIVFQKHILGVRWQVRAFSTNSRRYSPNEDSVSANANEYLPILSPSAQGTTIRDHLKDWQQQQRTLGATQHGALETNITGIAGAAQNSISQSGVDDTPKLIDRDDNPPEEEYYIGRETVESLSERVYRHVFLRKGDVVELRSNGEPMLAVFIRQWDQQSQFYTVTGNWVHRNDGRISFVVPQLISASQLDPILPFLPTGPVPGTSLDQLNAMDSSAPRGAGAMIIAELNHFHRLATEIILKNGNQIYHAFDVMALPHESSSTTLEDITMKVLQIADPSELTHPALWAVHKMITGTEHFQVDLFQTRRFPRIHVSAKKHAEDIGRIRTWVREYQEQIIANVTGIESEPIDHDMINPLPSFLEKARALIAYSRERRAVTKHGCIGPIKLKIEENPIEAYNFNPDELTIAHFISRWASGYLWRVDSNLTTIVPMILRATGMYDGFELGISTAFVFSQEIGMNPSWANRDSKNPMLPLREYGEARDRIEKLAIGEPKSLETETNLKDSMASFRKDWADMRVFCIDKDSTHEVDDGVSLEEIPEDTSAFWVHVHVANPSAFIAPTSRTGLFAEKLIASRYLIHKRVPMLPPSLSESYFSLANGRPCITFSAKVTNDGDIAETKLSHGTIRNVKHITPEHLHRELVPERTHASRRFTIVVGKREEDLSLTSPCNSTVQNSEMRPAAVPERLLTSDLKLLHKLSEIGAARRRKRIQAGAIAFPMRTSSEVTVVPFVSSKERHRFESFDPIISLTTETINPFQAPHHDHESDKMVENLMILAGEVAASWCVQRNMPVSYTGTLRNTEPSESPELYRQKFLDPVLAEKGSNPLPIIIQYLKLIGTSVSTPVPMKHLLMGVPAYCRVTSPLRRYGDLLAHWQIEAAIRRESATGSSLIGNTDNSYLPFPFSRVEALAPRITHYENLIRMVGSSSAIHWMIQLLFRAFYFKEATLPETFNICISHLHKPYPPVYSGWPVEIGILCEVPENEVTRKQGGVFQGDVWESRISDIDCYYRRILMAPIRLVSRGETRLTPHA